MVKVEPVMSLVSTHKRLNSGHFLCWFFVDSYALEKKCVPYEVRVLRFRKMTIPGLGYMFAHELDLVAFSVDTMGKLDILGHGMIVTRLA